LAFVCLPTALAFPCIVIGLLALPLCGAALTFFAAGVCQGSCRCAKKESDGTSLYMLYP
jgi:hypothetical protein